MSGRRTLLLAGRNRFYMSYTTSSTHAESDSPIENRPVPIHQKPGARQFVKFCIVGFSSTIINFAVVNGLHYKAHFQVWPSVIYGFLLSCVNGFIWNRQWTFKQSRSNSVATQSVRFVAVNIVGLVLNCSIVAILIALYESSKGSVVNTHHFIAMFESIAASQHKFDVPKLVLNGALLVATGVVVFWNFFANRLWTFKHKKKAA